MGNPKQFDWGGLDLIVNTVKTGATKPGQAGTDINTGNRTFSGTVTFSANPVLTAGTTIGSGSATATLASNAATVTTYATVITTESLTTAAGSSQALVITLTGVAAGDLAFVTKAGGTNTRHNYQLEVVNTTNTITVTVYNTEPTNALNGTLKFNLWVVKA